jgi:hypothetical protein
VDAHTALSSQVGRTIGTQRYHALANDLALALTTPSWEELVAGALPTVKLGFWGRLEQIAADTATWTSAPALRNAAVQVMAMAIGNFQVAAEPALPASIETRPALPEEAIPLPEELEATVQEAAMPAFPPPELPGVSAARPTATYPVGPPGSAPPSPPPPEESTQLSTVAPPTQQPTPASRGIEIEPVAFAATIPLPD